MPSFAEVASHEPEVVTRQAVTGLEEVKRLNAVIEKAHENGPKDLAKLVAKLHVPLGDMMTKFSAAREQLEAAVVGHFNEERKLMDALHTEANSSLQMFLANNEKHKQKSDKALANFTKGRDKVVDNLRSEKDSCMKDLKTLQDAINLKQATSSSSPDYAKLDQKVAKLRVSVSTRFQKYKDQVVAAREKQQAYYDHVPVYLTDMETMERFRLKTMSTCMSKCCGLFLDHLAEMQKTFHQLKDTLDNLNEADQFAYSLQLIQHQFGPPEAPWFEPYSLPCSPEDVRNGDNFETLQIPTPPPKYVPTAPPPEYTSGGRMRLVASETPREKKTQEYTVLEPTPLQPSASSAPEPLPPRNDNNNNNNHNNSNHNNNAPPLFSSSAASSPPPPSSFSAPDQAEEDPSREEDEGGLPPVFGVGPDSSSAPSSPKEPARPTIARPPPSARGGGIPPRMAPRLTTAVDADDAPGVPAVAARGPPPPSMRERGAPPPSRFATLRGPPPPSRGKSALGLGARLGEDTDDYSFLSGGYSAASVSAQPQQQQEAPPPTFSSSAPAMAPSPSFMAPPMAPSAPSAPPMAPSAPSAPPSAPGGAPVMSSRPPASSAGRGDLLKQINAGKKLNKIQPPPERGPDGMPVEGSARGAPPSSRGGKR